MNSSNIIIVVILILILVPAVRTAIKHMQGEGDCCGGPKEKVPKKKIAGKKQGEYIVSIEGMHCQNCKNRIERHLNEIEGVVSKVNLGRKQAVVSYYQPVDEKVIREVIEGQDFTVTDIQKHQM